MASPLASSLMSRRQRHHHRTNAVLATRPPGWQQTRGQIGEERRGPRPPGRSRSGPWPHGSTRRPMTMGNRPRAITLPTRYPREQEKGKREREIREEKRDTTRHRANPLPPCPHPHPLRPRMHVDLSLLFPARGVNHVAGVTIIELSVVSNAITGSDCLVGGPRDRLPLPGQPDGRGMYWTPPPSLSLYFPLCRHRWE